MKISRQEDYKVWLKEQTNLVTQVKAAIAAQLKVLRSNDSLKAKIQLFAKMAMK
jgi:hypothetical protein